MTIDVAALPHDLDAERAALGAVLVAPEHFAAIAAVVSPVDFYRQGHREIYSAFRALIERGSAVDFITLKDELTRAGKLDEAGGPAYIATLADGLPRSTNASFYANIVKECASAREVIRLFRRATDTLLKDPAKLGNGLPAMVREQFDRIVEAATPQAEAKRYPLLDDVAVLDRPDPGWDIEGITPAGGFIPTYGETGIGKTGVLLGIALSQASGKPWLGHAVHRRGPVVYQVGEGAGAIGRRIGAWKITHDVPLDERVGLHLWYEPVNLLDAGSVRHFIDGITPLQPVTVVVDTWARGLIGGDENSARDVGLAIAHVGLIQRTLEATVHVVHHSNRANSGERGSGALRGAADAMFSLVKVDDQLRLSCEKQKDAEPFTPIDLKLQPVAGASACVMRLASDVLPAEALSDAQGKALHALRELFPGSEGATCAEWQKSLPEMVERTFYHARTKLLDKGYIRAVGKHYMWTGKCPPVNTAID